MDKILYILFYGLVNYSSFALSSENYRYDELGFRSTTDISVKVEKKYHLIIAGDSNVFGDGCKDDETLSSLINKEINKFHTYNWGIRGGGPHDSLYLMEFKNALKLIKESNGVMVYNFFPFLTERVIGSKNYLKWSLRNSPFYQLNKHNEAVYMGNFDDRFFITSFYKYINDSKLLDFLIPRLPQIHRWHLDLVAGIFGKMELIYKSKFPNGKFIVILNDSYDDDPKYIWQNKLLSELLPEKQLSFKKIPIVEDFKKKYTFSDGHINPLGQKVQAQFYNDLLKVIISEFK